MIARRIAFGVVACVALICIDTAFAQSACDPAPDPTKVVPFLLENPSAKDVKGELVPLEQLLGPPAPEDSQITASELQEVISLQKMRTFVRAEQAKADEEESICRFLGGMGVTLKPDNAKNTVELFQRISSTEYHFTKAPKDYFRRLRPYKLDAENVIPLGKKSSSYSYPSGHATFSAIAGALLIKMVPERAGDVFLRVDDYSWSRVVAGAHFRSDIQAGKIAGFAIAEALEHDDEFNKLFEGAKAELRTAFGVAP